MAYRARRKFTGESSGLMRWKRDDEHSKYVVMADVNDNQIFILDFRKNCFPVCMSWMHRRPDK